MTLLPTQVRAIRRALKCGDTYKSIAERYGTYPMVVWQIHQGRAYKHVPVDVTPRLHASWLETVRARNERYVEKWPLFHRALAEIEAEAA